MNGLHSPFAVVAVHAGIVAMFERRLKELNPALPTISYDIADLYAYLDTFHDFTALMYGAGAADCGLCVAAFRRVGCSAYGHEHPALC